ncbi:hypothetical protein PHLGIDRAFT_117790 [Phlebiopsis gigantea 11061_1 CR5-6]|uniref:NADP-dependent oxidoreductase domain-containing protein n=1 Tax=Phlebiopsis gigantea (strain 11061_1 CR5-6) TaxID=745531 RepID=A0A0C3SBC8_PHLG1|nr:hypothetical protein PHLGIDRAFT_117790 [Phlebiopsis gigantea 11061_1 CR5-6]
MHRTNDWALFISLNRILDAKGLYVFPIIGGRKVGHLYQNLEALELSLTPGQIKALDNIVPFDKGFPFIAFGDATEYNALYKSAGYFEKWPKQETIRPAKQ